MLRAGFQPYDEVLALVVQVDPHGGKALLDELWDARFAEQAAWPKVVDGTRLAAAFLRLERDGVVTRTASGCCRTCPHREIAEEAGPLTTKRGYVFFPAPAGREVLTGSLELSFGTLGRSAGMWDRTGYDHATLALGEEIVLALRRAGLSAAWSGSPPRTIVVTGLDWKRRLPERPS